MEVENAIASLEGTVVGFDDYLGLNPIVRDSRGKEIYVFTSPSSYYWARNYWVDYFVKESVGKKVWVQVSNEPSNADGKIPFRFAVSKFEFSDETRE